MAMSLDELLGIENETANDVFPATHEEFIAMRERRRSMLDSRGEIAERPYSSRGAERQPLFPEYEERGYEQLQAQRGKYASFYNFAANDYSRLSERELEEKLSYTNDGARPIFDRSNGAVAENTYIRNTQAISEGADTRQKMKGRLTLAGKLIVGSFVANIITVVSLIIAFGSKINNGTATVPTSSVTIVAEQSI